jgi:pimeloyl-ACP methyl ester carboxylesterase
MPIEYDASTEALLHPERRETVFRAGQQYELVQLAVEMARLAYYKAEISSTERERLAAALNLVGFSRFEHFSSAIGAQAFAASRPADRLALVAFRGTEADSLQDIGIDASFLPVKWQGPGLVHSGFSRAFDSLRVALKQWLDAQAPEPSALLVCGHSLGAAMATLAASAWGARHLITIGGPRVGNREFLASLEAVQCRRIFNCCDLVARVPPAVAGYQHTPNPTFVTAASELVENPPEAAIDLERHRGRAEFFRHHAGRPGNVPARDLADHAPVNYLRVFFP